LEFSSTPHGRFEPELIFLYAIAVSKPQFFTFKNFFSFSPIGRQPAPFSQAA